MSDTAVRQQKKEEEGQEFTKVFSAFASMIDGGHSRKAAIAALLKDHLTNQQSVMRFLMEIVEAVSENRHDGRNEASVALAKRIMEIPLEDRILPYI